MKMITLLHALTAVAGFPARRASLLAGQSYREKAHARKKNIHYSGKHWRGSNAPVCTRCRVTLSQGECLNRMCERFIGISK